MKVKSHQYFKSVTVFIMGTIVIIFTTSEKQNVICQLILTFIISDLVRVRTDLLV